MINIINIIKKLSLIILFTISNNSFASNISDLYNIKLASRPIKSSSKINNNLDIIDINTNIHKKSNKTANNHLKKRSKTKKSTKNFNKNDKILQNDDFDEEFSSYEQNNQQMTDFVIKDPLEKFNRRIYNFNLKLDDLLFTPVVRVYQKTPYKIRSSIRNFTNNINAPISVFNSLLQGKVDNALSGFSCFLINSTIGIAGIFNVAGEKGIISNKEDFGQTLSFYGIKNTPYLMLPILGPSSVGDFTASLADMSLSPTGFNVLEIGKDSSAFSGNNRIALNTISAIDKRESLDQILQNLRQDSFDSYATIRSAYLQKRQFEAGH